MGEFFGRSIGSSLFIFVFVLCKIGDNFGFSFYVCKWGIRKPMWLGLLLFVVNFVEL